MEDAQEQTLLCWEGGPESEVGGIGALGMSEGRLLMELQRLMEPYLEEKAELCRDPAVRRPGSSQSPLPTLHAQHIITKRPQRSLSS